MTSTMASAPLTHLAAPQRAPYLEGQVLTPGDGDYDEARTVFPRHRPAPRGDRPLANVETSPAVIAIARESGDGARGARRRPQRRRLRGQPTAASCVDMRDMRGSTSTSPQAGLGRGRPHRRRRTPRRRREHGLATGFGDAGTVGIGGITLGGGVGY